MGHDDEAARDDAAPPPQRPRRRPAPTSPGGEPPSHGPRVTFVLANGITIQGYDLTAPGSPDFLNP